MKRLARSFLASMAVAWIAIPFARATDPAFTVVKKLDYVVKRNGEPIGTLKITHSQNGKRLVVESDYSIKVDIALIVVYRYDKRMREVYENGRLVAYETDIDDNGEKSQVRVVRDGGHLRIDQPTGKSIAPFGTLVSTYWPPETVNQTTLIDSSDGSLAKVAVSNPIVEIIEIDGRLMSARYYRMSGDLKRELWYAADGRGWLKMRLEAREDSTIEIERDWPPVWKGGQL